jgi:succinate dehydrogenase / fumarate reductase iron-sulfur subunit
VIRDRDQQDKFVGPRFMIRLASLEMHPLDDDDRIPEIRKEFGSGMCNITRCCTEVCPEHIGITDNGIIPLKERVVDRYFDPITVIGRKLFGIRKRTKARSEEAEK